MLPKSGRMPRKTPPRTPLLEVLRRCTLDEQNEIARMAGTKRNYLFQLGSCQRKQTTLRKGLRIVQAVATMHARSCGRIPKITLEELATMCPLPFDDSILS